MTPNKTIRPQQITSEEIYEIADIENVYEDAFSSYGAQDADYAYDNFDMDNYGYESY